MTRIRQLALAHTADWEVLYEDPAAVDTSYQSRARREGLDFDGTALDRLEQLGATVVQGRHTIGPYSVDAELRTANGRTVLVAAHGNVGDTSRRPGLRRTDTVAKVFMRAVGLHARGAPPLVVVTSHLPLPGSTAAAQLADLHTITGPWLVDVVATEGDLRGLRRLQTFFTTTPAPTEPAPAPWWTPDHQAPVHQPALFRI